MAGTAGIGGRGAESVANVSGPRGTWSKPGVGGQNNLGSRGGVAVCAATSCTCISAIYIKLWVLGSPRADTRARRARSEETGES